MKTKKGKRTAHFGVQIVENPNNITLFFDGHDLPPMIFSAKTGQSGKKAHSKLKKILREVEAGGETKAVTAAVKTVSKEAVKAVSDRIGKANGK